MKKYCKCDGKGYGTQFQRVTGSGDFEQDNFEKTRQFAVILCPVKGCIRAAQLKKYFTIKKKYMPIY